MNDWLLVKQTSLKKHIKHKVFLQSEQIFGLKTCGEDVESRQFLKMYSNKNVMKIYEKLNF